MEKIQQFFSDNPVWGGVFIAAIGLFILFASIFDWEWIFGNVNRATYSLNKIDGIVNFLGRKTARVIAGFTGVIVILAGILWIWIYMKK